MENRIANCCILCKTKTIDELNYGPMYSDENIAVHLYCMVINQNLIEIILFLINLINLFSCLLQVFFKMDPIMTDLTVSLSRT